jgi:hypothetical protein
MHGSVSGLWALGGVPIKKLRNYAFQGFEIYIHCCCGLLKYEQLRAMIVIRRVIPSALYPLESTGLFEVKGL